MISIKTILQAFHDVPDVKLRCRGILWDAANREYQQIVDSGDLLENKLDRLAQLRDESKEQERILHDASS